MTKHAYGCRRAPKRARERELETAATMSGSSPPTQVKNKGTESSEDTAEIISENEEDIDGEHCSICLQSFVDRTVIPECSHEFCFDCILTWAGALQATTENHVSHLYLQSNLVDVLFARRL